MASSEPDTAAREQQRHILTIGPGLVTAVVAAIDGLNAKFPDATVRPAAGGGMEVWSALWPES